MDFERAVDILLGPEHEGGYQPDRGAADPGGETKFGISKRSYPHLNIKALTRAQAVAIYRSDFWGQLPPVDPVVRFVLFDLAVNSGVRRATQILQDAVGVVTDGRWGPKSQATYGTMDPVSVALLTVAKRMRFQADLNNWSSNSRGWTRRNAANLEILASEILK